MENIPTAKQYIDLNPELTEEEILIAFTKLHVQAALKTAANNARCIYVPPSYSDNGETIVNRNSIITAYPLTNIQ